jgi:phage terminase small subunit
MSTWVQAGTQLRHLASALGLSPDARGRSGIREIEPDRESDNSDPLTGGNPFLAPNRLLT